MTDHVRAIVEGEIEVCATCPANSWNEQPAWELAHPDLALKEVVGSLLPWQRDIYEQFVAAGPGAQFIWVSGRRGGKFKIQRALELRAEVERQDDQ